VYADSHKSEVYYWTNHRKVVWGYWGPNLTSFPEEVKSWTAVPGIWLLFSSFPVQFHRLNIVRHIQDFSVTQPLQLKWCCETYIQTTIPQAHAHLRMCSSRKITHSLWQLIAWTKHKFVSNDLYVSSRLSERPENLSFRAHPVTFRHLTHCTVVLQLSAKPLYTYRKLRQNV
jgi:hypothetical protein